MEEVEVEEESIAFSVFALNSYNALNFNNVSNRFRDRVESIRMKITEESEFVGESLAEMLTKSKISEILKYNPYVHSGNISASALRTAKHLRDKLSQLGRKFYHERGGLGEFTSYIDVAVRHIIREHEAENDFSSVYESITAHLPMFPEEVHGTPDAMWKNIPIEIKTASSIESFFSSVGRQNRALNQLAFYQHATNNVRGFLIVICRETGDIICFEATSENISFAMTVWRCWMSPFSQASETVFANMTIDMPPVSACALVSSMMYKQLSGIPREIDEIRAFEKLSNLISLLNDGSKSEINSEEKGNLITKHDEWLKHMFDIALD